MSVKEEVAAHLEAKKTGLTALECLKLYGSMRLGARIRDLREEGVDITTILETKGGKTYARYKLTKFLTEKDRKQLGEAA